MPRLAALLLALAALASCAQTPPAVPPAGTDSARLARELDALIGPATCSTDTQCRTVAVGAKACGGPSGYRAWSTAGTDAGRLAELAARQSEAGRRELAAEGRLSHCAVVTDPGATCVAGRCQLTSSTTGTVDAGRPFSLRVGETVRLTNESLQLGFDGVSADSRCPKGEQCVTAGDAIVRIWWRQGDAARQTRELHLDARAVRSARVGSLTLELLGLEPAPLTGRSIAPGAYVATLVLGREAAGEASR